MRRANSAGGGTDLAASTNVIHPCQSYTTSCKGSGRRSSLQDRSSIVLRTPTVGFRWHFPDQRLPPVSRLRNSANYIRIINGKGLNC